MANLEFIGFSPNPLSNSSNPIWAKFVFTGLRGPRGPNPIWPSWPLWVFLQSEAQPFKGLTAQLGIHRFLFRSNFKPFKTLSGLSWFLQASVPMAFHTLSGQVGARWKKNYEKKCYEQKHVKNHIRQKKLKKKIWGQNKILTSTFFF